MSGLDAVDLFKIRRWFAQTKGREVCSKRCLLETSGEDLLAKPLRPPEEFGLSDKLELGLWSVRCDAIRFLENIPIAKLRGPNIHRSRQQFTCLHD